MTDLYTVLHNYAERFAPVVPFNPSTDKLLLLDFTASNKDLHESTINDTSRFSAYIIQKLDEAGAHYGIGGYAEHRTIYSRSELFNAGNAADEPRRLHLGTDIWAPAGTPVMAPLDGIVHSVADNGRRGDYGATIVLAHSCQGISFHTLYGHLSHASLKNKRPGQAIAAGETFAWFGTPEDNGQWPPHLHIQMIVDMGGRFGDYPGVCKFSERQQWLLNSPDPDLLLQLHRYL